MRAKTILNENILPITEEKKEQVAIENKTQTVIEVEPDEIDQPLLEIQKAKRKNNIIINQETNDLGTA